jgi:protease YdgD
LRAAGILAGLSLLLTLAAALATGAADELPAGPMTVAQASKVVAQLGLETKPSSDDGEIEVTWIEGSNPVTGSIALNTDGRGMIKSVDPLAPIPAALTRYLNRSALQGFALRWNARNPGPEYLELDKSGVFYLTVMYPRVSGPYDASLFRRQIGDFRAALRRALDELDRESKANALEGDKAYASDWELADPSQLPARAVGRLETQGGYLCTATLVADDVILTAAHCVMDDKGRHLKPLVFNAGIDHGDSVATAGILAVRVDPAYDPAHQFDGNTIDNPAFGRDWALLQLDAPIGRQAGVIEVFAATRSELDRMVRDFNTDVIQIGYGGQGGRRPKLRHNCGPADVLDARYYTTQCGLAKGDSGSPLLLHDDGKYRIIGINYAWIDLDFVNHVFLVVGSAAFDPTLKDLVAGKLQATLVRDWVKDATDGAQAGATGKTTNLR